MRKLMAMVMMVMVLMVFCGCGKVFSRSDFSNAVVGKTKDQIIAAVGKPTRTQESSNGSPGYWYYDRKTKDSVTGKVDNTIQVCFQNERCYKISY